MAIGLATLSSLVAQGLPEAWSNYFVANDDLERANSQELVWINELAAVRLQIQALKNQRLWYNGWIIDIGIAGKIADEFDLANDIDAIRANIVALEAAYKTNFNTLKSAYGERMAIDGNKISLAEKDQTIQFAQLLQSNGRIRWDFPDYSAMVAEPYESAQLKELVLNDLYTVVKTRLAFIDSVMAEKIAERALIERLEEFQADLSYQLESNIEVTDETEREPAADDIDFPAGLSPSRPGADNTFSEGNQSGQNEVNTESIDAAAPSAEIDLPKSIMADANSANPPSTIIGQISKLQGIRRQYEDTLKKIDSALAN